MRLWTAIVVSTMILGAAIVIAITCVDRSSTEKIFANRVPTEILHAIDGKAK